MNKWQRFRKLPASERGILLRALILLPLTAAALRTIGFRRWKLFLAKFTAHKNSSTPVTPESLQSARRIARLVAAASDEGIVHGKCLEQSIVLWWLLMRRGVPAELQIGGRRTSAGFEAHAWVEIAGTVVSDRDTVHQEFAPFGRDATSLGIEPR